MLSTLRDDARIVQGIGCICMLALGYYLVFQKYYVSGLGMCVFFSFALANSIQGFVNSQKVLYYAKFTFVKQVALWADTWTLNDYSKNELEKAFGYLDMAGALMSIEDQSFEVSF